MASTPKRTFTRSQALYERTLKTIPLASQTFSKSAMQYVRGASPLFLERGDGCRVWDVDGNEYLDYVLGLLPVVLGYRDPDVDGAIRRQLDRGITFSLATELEAELAERLVRLIPCAEQVRFGKNGSDATTAAIRLARAYTGRDRVAVCGYHGWHDWYIGTTSRHLGVPEAVRGLSSTFPFNDADALETLLKADPNGYAAVILEPAGMQDPAPGFLQRLRELTERYGAVLIFDEIVTGFRINLGGAQKVYGVTPDLATFGKSMANGMPISAVVGRRDIMSWMDKIFFSGTFGGEALSLAAAIATIDKLDAAGVCDRLRALGGRLAKDVRAALSRYKLEEWYTVCGPDWWPFVIASAKDGVSDVITTSLLRQELIANGLLMGGTFNLCLAHDHPDVLKETLAAWDQAMAAVSSAFASSDPAARLRGHPIQPVFSVRPVKR